MLTMTINMLKLAGIIFTMTSKRLARVVWVNKGLSHGPLQTPSESQQTCLLHVNYSEGL